MSVLKGLSSSSHGGLDTIPNRHFTAPVLALADPFQDLRHYEQVLRRHGMTTHFFETNEQVRGRHVRINGKPCLSFSSYDYLGFACEPRVQQAAMDATTKYGTSASGSRLIAGECTLHRELEHEIATLIGAEDALAFVSGHSTNVTVLGSLFGPDDLILYDGLAHNSIQQGIRLSGANAYRFAHNNLEQVESILERRRHKFQRALIVTEGVFSMDGDVPPVPALIELKHRYGAYLMVDEAHSMGVIGATGRGIVDHFSLAAPEVDIWMGTLSKSLASCGGYIAGSKKLIESLRYGAPGFVYSCGMSPANAASALASARLLKQEPGRVQQIAKNVALFRSLMNRSGLDTGSSRHSAVVPIIVGCSLTTLFASHLLHTTGLIVHPLFYPVVPADAARLRLFVTALHTTEEIISAASKIIEAVEHARQLAKSELKVN